MSLHKVGVTLRTATPLKEKKSGERAHSLGIVTPALLGIERTYGTPDLCRRRWRLSEAERSDPVVPSHLPKESGH
jgi:hypothetical protein